jgi:hypothetical protein
MLDPEMSNVLKSIIRKGEVKYFCESYTIYTKPHAQKFILKMTTLSYYKYKYKYTIWKYDII